MAYSIRFRSRAKDELEESCDIYGGTFRGQVLDWLAQLAEEAEHRQSFSSIDLQELLNTIADDPAEIKQLTSSWGRWLQAPFMDKLKAILVVLRKRCPPWEFRASLQTFTVIDTFTSEVHVLYEVDHVHRQVILTKFTGLPGQ
jgi:hypothetical protein